MSISEENKRQRKIGKQLLMVSILKSEAERAERIGITYITKDDIEEWTSMSKEEVSDFCHSCQSLLKTDLAMMAAGKYKNNAAVCGGKDMFRYAYYTCMNFDSDFLEGFSEQSLIDYCNANEEANYESFFKRTKDQVEDGKNRAGMFRSIVDCYLKSFVATVDKVLSNGYDWDVVSEMMWLNISQYDYILLSEKYAA